MNPCELYEKNDSILTRRVAMVITELRLGGAERVVVHLARSFVKYGVSVCVICLREKGQLACELEHTPVQLNALHSHRGYDFVAIKRLANILRRFKPRLVNVHDYTSLPYVALAQGIIPRWPIVFSAHGLLFEGFEKPRLRYRLPARRLAAMTAVSDQVAERHRQHLNWPGHIDIIPNGVPGPPVNPGHRSIIRDELNIAPDVFVFLAVGNARPEKAFEDLLNAAALLQHTAISRPFVVLVSGLLPETAYCRELLAARERLNLNDTVRFLGFRGDIASLHSAADAFVLSSRSEGLPLVLLEAMMAGLPIVATRVGGVPAVVENGMGILVDPAAPQQLSDAMQTLLTDAQLCATTGENAAQHARANYSIEQMATRYLRTFDYVIAKKNN